MPMLEVLKKSGLQNVLAVCTRYFGGTLLGAGGLVRAYTQSVAQTLDEAPKVKLVSCSVYQCGFDFAVFSRIQAPLLGAGYLFDDIAYSESVTAKISVISGCEDAFVTHVQNLTQGQSVPQFIGQKRLPFDV
jgi:putative IMPACT (imprinted ancient) family translation regulator